MESGSTMLYQHQGKITSLRALRVRKEMPDELLSKVIGCDMSETAIETFKENMKLNELGRLNRQR